MIKSKQFSVIITLLVIISPCVTSVGAIDNNNQIYLGKSLLNSKSFMEKYKTNFKSPDTYAIVAYSSISGSGKYLAFDQVQTVLNFLQLADEAQKDQLTDLKNQYINDSQATLKFLTSYLANPLTRDKNGVIEFWDSSLQDTGLTRVSKLARDQALLLLAIDQLLTFIDQGYNVESSLTLFYKETFSKLWLYLQTLYDSVNGGWYTKTTAINQTAYSVDKTKRTADNMIIISSLTQIKHINLLENGFTKDLLQNIIDKSINFFSTKFLVPNKGISSFGSFDGSEITTNSYFAKDNALYGLACLDVFNFNGNSTYLDESKNIWSYLKLNFLDGSFGGVFIGINEQGDPIIAGKSLEDQIFFDLLSLRLSVLVKDDPTYLATYLTLFALININYVTSSGIASSTDLRFNPSTEYYARSATYYIHFLIHTPHISAIILPKNVIVGSKLPLSIYFSNSLDIPLNLTVFSGSILDPVSKIVNTSSLNIELGFTSTITTGDWLINFQISILSSKTQLISTHVSFDPNVRIPNGLIYLVGAGILAGLVIIVRRPPAFLKKYIDDLKEEASEAVILENTESNV